MIKQVINCPYCEKELIGDTTLCISEKGLTKKEHQYAQHNGVYFCCTSCIQKTKLGRYEPRGFLLVDRKFYYWNSEWIRCRLSDYKAMKEKVVFT